MRYRLLDVELTRPLPGVRLDGEQVGIAVLIRKDDRPVDFFLQKLGAGTALAADELGVLISRWSAPAILEEAVRRELAGAPADPPRADVTVAICTRDRIAHLEPCLRSLLSVRAARGSPPGLDLL